MQQPIVFKGEEPDTEKSRLVHEALEWLDRFIEGHDFVVGNKLTVADFALIASVSTFTEAGIDLSGHPNVKNWADRCKNQMKGKVKYFFLNTSRLSLAFSKMPCRPCKEDEETSTITIFIRS
ncbi:hypothetical protein Anas_04842 [Armadillidium nasatum]|uniref:GST C-terminal domain-containing protein n=1 Tax=Armadillidium nasatum TaxID=96803 RepID=A0A5N5SUJ8_9CRUS|nr:hypothetical protein Anas_04842 [Armadillidium nasatum]